MKHGTQWQTARSRMWRLEALLHRHGLLLVERETGEELAEVCRETADAIEAWLATLTRQ